MKLDAVELRTRKITMDREENVTMTERATYKENVMMLIIQMYVHVYGLYTFILYTYTFCVHIHTIHNYYINSYNIQTTEV